MSEEETVEKIAEEPGEEAKEDAPPTNNNQDKFRLISGEEILENGEAGPSTLAFLGMYVLGALVFGVHLLFNNGIDAADDASFLLKLTATLIDVTNWESLPIGFVLVMCFITWANRMLHISTSGRWVTIALLAITFLPVIISIDNVLSAIAGLFGAEAGSYDFIPIDNYNYLISGLVPSPPTPSSFNMLSCSPAHIAASSLTVFQRSWLNGPPWEPSLATQRSPS